MNTGSTSTLSGMTQDVDVLPPAAASVPGRPGQVSRRFRRCVGGLITAFVLVPISAIGVLWPLMPSVGDAEKRIAARLASHGAKDPGALPRPDEVRVAVVAAEDSRFYSHRGLHAPLARHAMSAP